MYGVALRVAASNLSFLLYASILTFIASVYFVLVGGWVLSQCPTADRDKTPGDWLTGLAFAGATGLCTSLLLCTTSLYLTKSSTTGVLASVVIASTSIVSLWRKRSSINLVPGRIAALCIAVFALVLGLWHHVLTDFPLRTTKPSFVYSDLQGDLSFHVAYATIAESAGLPLLDSTGSHTYVGATHIGHSVLIANVAKLTGCTCYHASTAIWTFSYLLLGWAAAAIARRRSFRWPWMAGLAALLMGGFRVPDFGLLTSPLTPSDYPGEPFLVSRTYWSISQSLTIAVTAVAVLAYDIWCTRQDSSRSWRLIAMTSVMIGLSGLIKPSQAIFLGPSLIVCMALHRWQRREKCVAFAALVSAALLYLLPLFLCDDTAEGAGWELRPTVAQTRDVLKYLLGGSGVLVLMLDPLCRLVRNLRTGYPSGVDLPLIACGGAVLFAVLFREVRFIGFRHGQPNIWWGICGCMALLVPYGLSSSFQSAGLAQRSWSVIGLALLSTQIINGTLMAVAYPGFNLRDRPATHAEVLQSARGWSRPQDRFLVYPELAKLELMPYLARPNLVLSAMTPQKDREVIAKWYRLCQNKPVPDFPWERFDAFIVHERCSLILEHLVQERLTQSDLGHGYTLWKTGS